MNTNATHKLPEYLNTPLFKRVSSGIKALNTQAWPITIWNYLHQISTDESNSIISDINIVKSSHLYTKFNILAELLIYLKDHEYTNIRVLTTLANIIRKQASNIKISKVDRYIIRKYFETDDTGMTHFKEFCQYIKDKNILTAESVLLLNPFTFLINVLLFFSLMFEMFEEYMSKSL